MNQPKLFLLAGIGVVIGVVLLWGGFNSLTNVAITPILVDQEQATQASPSALINQIPNDQLAQVTKVVDGDTIEVLYQGAKYKVRYVGIDTPETVDPRRPVACFGREASDENKRLVEGKQVILKKDISESDKYQRLLRLVYLPLPNGQQLFVNDYLVRAGYAKNYTYPPDVTFTQQFLEAEREAREQKLGLWSSCKT